ncbi:MAG: AAA family ATPase [Candidatus Hodarchaeales archaeon]|jgi:adenylate kinase
MKGNILITGSTCTGKSTLGKELSKLNPNSELVESKEFLEKNNLLEEFDEERKSWIYSPDKLDSALEELLKTKNNIIFTGAPVIIDETLISLVIVLTCSKPVELRSRLENREYSESKISENIEAELIAEVQGEIESYYPIDKILILDSCVDDTSTLISKVKVRNE